MENHQAMPATQPNRYAFIGASGGLVLLLASTWLAVRAAGAPLGWAAAVQAQLAHPLLWLIDLAPLAMGYLGVQTDKAQAALAALQARLQALESVRSQALAQSQEALNRQSGEHEKLARSLRKAKDHADHASQTKTVLLASMSHDIRTPMQGVLGMIELMLDNAVAGSQSELLESARQSGRSLLLVLNNILDLSKLESGKLSLASAAFDLKQAVDESILPFAASGADRNLKIGSRVVGELPKDLIGDAQRFKQVLGNLLSNAVKFTVEGTVEVEVKVLEDRPQQALVRVAVADTGAGIDEAIRAVLFDVSAPKLDATPRGLDGSGLGLPIARRLTQLMGGEIGVESQAGQGSTFWFTARFDKAQALAATPGASAAPASGYVVPRALPADAPLRPLRILVAEDNEVNQHFARAILEKSGHQVEVAANGREAVEAAVRSRPDVILMDCQMPEMDGYEATRRIRKSGLGMVRIFALTANAEPEDRDLCLASGMDDYLAKPYSRQQLADLLHHWFAPAAA